MIRVYDDYRSRCKRYLKTWRIWEGAADCRREDVRYLHSVLDWTTEPMKRAAIQRAIAAHQQDIDAITRIHGQINDCLKEMSPDDARILRAHYIYGLPWDYVAEDEGYAYRTIMKRGARALGTLTRLVFNQADLAT